MTEMDTVCLKYRPPDPPIFSNTPPEVRDSLLKWRNDNPSYQDYAKLCNLTDVDGPSIRTSTLSTSTPDPVVSTVTTLPTVTTEVTNVSSVNNDTFLIPSTDLENLNPSSGDQAWIAAVVIPIVLIIAVVIVAWVIKRKKASQYEALFERFWCFYKGPQRHRGSMSSVGSKKSRAGSSISGEENQINGRPNPVVFTNQVTANVKDFKHSSTAQLIDECSMNKSEQGYVNTLVHSSMYELKEMQGSDTQTDSDVIKDDIVSQSHDMETSPDKGDDNQSKDSSIKFALIEEEKDLAEYSNTVEQCDQSSNQKDSKSITKDRQSVTKDPPSATKDISSANKDRESTAGLKSSLDIDLNSQPSVGKSPGFQSQASSDSGYDSQLVSPQDKTERWQLYSSLCQDR